MGATTVGQRVRLALLMLASLSVEAATSVGGGYFCGGSISFYFDDTSVNQSYKAHVTVMTGWVLGHGPCGPSCQVSDVGQPTKPRRDNLIQSTNNPALFGNWTTEAERAGTYGIFLERVTAEVNQDIQGHVSAVSTTLHYEQEIAHFEMDINATYRYTDVVLQGDSWKSFDLNRRDPRIPTGTSWFLLQTKIYPRIRSDTGKPNSSPLALYRPIYRLVLNSVTEIRLAVSDKDDDLVKCRMCQNVEIDGIGEMPNVTISKDCVITVSTMEHDGFRDDSWGVICAVLEDFNRDPIEKEGIHINPYTNTLSSSILNFMVWVVTSVTEPEFVTPTPASQHVFTVYAGSVLSIPLAAKPCDKCPPGTEVVAFNLVSLPEHNLTVPTPQPDPDRVAQRVVNTSLEWRTSDSDIGDFILQVVALDSNGYESMERNYKIRVRAIPQTPVFDLHPYFLFLPEPGTIMCPTNATCSVSIYAKEGTPGHVITSMSIADGKTDVPQAEIGKVVPVTHRGVHVYRADVQFSGDIWGNKSICFLAQDDHGLETERCLDVFLNPPNACDVDPCGHGVVCMPHGAGYSCICHPGFTGHHCDQWIDPCLSSPCQNGGTCVSRELLGNRYACRCAQGYSGPYDCATNIDDCASGRCQNGGICVDGVNDFHCVCVNGFGGSDCSNHQANNPCAGKNCQSNATCVVDTGSGQAVCKCPLGRQGADCATLNWDTPLLGRPGISTPHSVVPTLRPGSQITCNLGSTCQIPVYINRGTQGSIPRVVQGMTSLALTTSVTPAEPDYVTGLLNTLTSTLTVTPRFAGRYSACVDIEADSGPPEKVCYTINTPNPLASGPQPATTHKKFTDQTPQNGSVINCATSQPCHVLLVLRSEKPSSGPCEEIRAATEGVYTFATRYEPSTNSCATDILLDPTSQPAAYVCVAVGFGGERRCYTVYTTDDTAPGGNPCDSFPCQNNGVCMLDSGPAGFSCACPSLYEGTLCDIGIPALGATAATTTTTTGTEPSCIQWIDDLQDNQQVYACTGSDVSLPWTFSQGSGASIVSIEWFFNGLSQEMIAMFSHGSFVPLPAFSQRVEHTTNGGLVLRHVIAADSGNFSVEVNGADASGELCTLRHTAHVVVSDDLTTPDGQLHLTPRLVYDDVTVQWSLQLTCGNFAYQGQPPFPMEWVMPSGRRMNSTGYHDNHFYLLVPNPAESGRYTCRVPDNWTSQACLSPGQPREANLTLDSADIKLMLMEGELGSARLKVAELQEENQQLKVDNQHLAQKVSTLDPAGQGCWSL